MDDRRLFEAGLADQAAEPALLLAVYVYVYVYVYIERLTDRNHGAPPLGRPQRSYL